MRARGWLLGWCLLACGGRSQLDAIDSGGGAEEAGAGEAGTALRGIEFATCSPADGPAFGLRVTPDPAAACVQSQPPAGEFDEIDAWMPLPPAPADLAITETNGHGAACAFTEAGTACTVAASTRLHIESTSGGVVRGDYTMTLPDGTTRSRAFAVEACAFTATCG